MIELLIISAAIALVLAMGAIALVLLKEVRKQKRPSSHRLQPARQSSQLTPAQQKNTESLGYLGGSIGIIATALGRVAGLSLLEIFLLGLALALVAGLVTWLIIRNSSNTSTVSNLAPSPPTELQRQLIRMCGGDRETAERLAALERGDWQAAIDRLIRDRL